MKHSLKFRLQNRCLIGLFAVTLVSAVSVYAQTEKTTEKFAETGKTTPKMVHLTLDNPSYVQKTDTQTGDNFIYQSADETLRVTGKHAVYHRNTKFLTATGNVVIDDPKTHITGDKAEVDDTAAKRLAIITGINAPVVITVKPKSETADGTPPPADKETNVKEERKRGVVVTCKRVESFYKKKFTIMRGEPIFTQKIKKSDGKEVTRVMTCEHVEYDGKTEKAVLFAPVTAKDSDGQQIIFDPKSNVFVGTKEGEETLESKGSTQTILLPDDEETK